MKKLVIQGLALLLAIEVCCTFAIGAALEKRYFLALHYESEREIRIPLPVLDEKPIRATLDPEQPFVLTDGIHLSRDGRYLDALCRFADVDGGNWEVRFSVEPLKREGYSLLTVGLHPEKERVQQIDFTFRGMPVEKFNITLPPFSLLGLQTSQGRWFSLVLLVE